MPASVISTKDDRLTLIAISALACILQDVLHEGLGHGVTAWLSGAHRVTMSTVALQSDIDTRLISANGTVVNLVFAAIFWLLLLRPQRYRPATRYFLVLAMAGNLFTGTGYFLFSGVFNFGDWAAVIRGLQPHWMWQLGLVVLGVASYYGSMLVVAAKLRAFQEKDENSRRLRGLCWTPYFTDGILAGLGGLLNPFGIFYVVASALPSTLGANAGLLSLPGMMRRSRPAQEEQVGPLRRGAPWIVTGLVASLLFIFVLGRGFTWSRSTSSSITAALSATLTLGLFQSSPFGQNGAHNGVVYCRIGSRSLPNDQWTNVHLRWLLFDANDHRVRTN